MRVERKPGFRLVRGGPVPPGAAAITIRGTVFAREHAADDERLLLHEAVHVRQWNRVGTVRFLSRYLWEYLVGRMRGLGHDRAYLHISAECEAEWEAQRKARRLPVH